MQNEEQIDELMFGYSEQLEKADILRCQLVKYHARGFVDALIRLRTNFGSCFREEIQPSR